MSDQIALQNNQKLFDVYAKKLFSSDVRAFSDVTEKLATWLNNPKAYYTEARPEIIKLLTIAQTTVQGAVDPTKQTGPFHVSQYKEHPLIPPYTKLMQVVRGYMNYFVEQDLGARIRQLVSTVSVPLPLPAKATSQEVHTPVSSSKEAKVAQSPRVTSSSSTPVPSSTADNRNAALAGASAASTSLEPEKPQLVVDSTTAPLQGTSQRVKRKRKTLDYLIDVDQKKFRMSTPSTQPNMGSSSLDEEAITKRPTDADAHSANIFRPSENASQDAASQVASVPTKEASIGPNESRQSFVDKTVVNEVSSEKHPVQKSEEQDDQFIEFPPDLSGVAAQRVESAGISSGSKDISLEPLEIKAERTPSHDGGFPKSTQPGLPSSEQVDKGESAIPLANSEAAERNEDDAMQVDEADEQFVREQVAPESDDMELDSETSFQEQVVNGLQRLHARLSQCVSLMPHSDQDIGSIISEDQGVITFEAVENLSDRTGIPSPGPSEQAESLIHTESTCQKVELSDVDVREALNSGLNGLSAMYQSLEKIKVPILVRGLSNPGKVKIGFEIKVGIYSALLRWTRRMSPLWNVSDAICVTLGCYEATETALKVVASKNERNWQEFVSLHQPSWPQAGGFRLLLTSGKQYDLPLSPPLLMTQDGLVDLSPYLIEGANGIELDFTRDSSKYVFALVLHPPTPAQWAWKSERCKREQDWKDWIKLLSRPFNVKPIPLLTR